VLRSEHLVVRLGDTSFEKSSTVEQARAKERARERQCRRSSDDRLIEIEEGS
jgi:hypothetical protein